MNQHAEERTQQLSSRPGSPLSCRGQREVVPPVSSQGAACSTSAFLIHPEPTCCGLPVGSAAIKAQGPPVRTTPLGRLQTLVDRRTLEHVRIQQEEEAVISQKQLGWEKTNFRRPSKEGGGRSKGTLGLLELQDTALR